MYFVPTHVQFKKILCKDISEVSHFKLLVVHYCSYFTIDTPSNNLGNTYPIFILCVLPNKYMGVARQIKIKPKHRIKHNNEHM